MLFLIYVHRSTDSRNYHSEDNPPSVSKDESGWLEPRPVSPAPSNVSMKSDRSKGEPLSFSKDKAGSTDSRNRSQDDPPSFSKDEPGWLEPRPASPAPSNVSMKSDRSKGEPLSFSKDKAGLPEHKRSVSHATGNVSESDPLDFTAGLSDSKETDQDEQDIRRGKDVVKRRILNQHEKELKEHETDTELYEIQDVDSAGAKAQPFKALFLKSKKNEVRTVLMKGVAGVGKTFQTKLFMVDWAKGKSNKKIDLIVLCNFGELNSRKEDLSLKDLIRHSFNEDRVGDYNDDDKCTVAFVLDGLEECKLPLNFAKNKDLTNVEEPASMDVLLTNLIKGNLLPSAKLWIISQPSGVDKIPPRYIEKVTECRETSKRCQKLTSAMRERFLKETNQEEDINHPNQKNTEHIMRENQSGEVNGEENIGHTKVKSVTQVHAGSDIFKNIKGNKIRSVLTTGDAGIGKSFHVQKFIKQWAKKDKQSQLSDVVFLLHLSELNLIKDTEVSLMGLLNVFYEETNAFVISNFEQFNVLFVLDGLEAYHQPLDLDNIDRLTDVRAPASVDVILTNLIRGTLFPSARIWITSRLKSLDAWVDRTTEIRCKPHVASQQRLKSQLKEQFSFVPEGIDMQRPSALLNEIYTDLHIVEGEVGEVNAQPEIKQIQDAKFKQVGEETLIKYHDIFNPTARENIPIRTVLTMGVAGIGKTFATKKYMLDWAEGKDNGDIFYMFPLSFRELNLRKGQEHSLEELIHQFYPGMKTSEILNYDQYRILIVLDGLDECRVDLDFSQVWTDMRKPTSIDVLLTNLIEGNLLSKAQLWITSRPAASNHIPAEKVDRVIVVQGFNDEQKEEYFKKYFKRFNDKDFAEKILSHVKKCRSLYIMCHIPVFCWITAKVLEDFVNRNEEGRMPKTMTDLYIHFLVLQCRQATVKYGEDETVENADTDSCWNTRNKETVMSLGKLAFDGLKEGSLLYTKEHLTECKIDITKTAVFSGLFTQIKQKTCGLYQNNLFCFVHLSIQEFMAALYVFHTFNNTGENLLAMPAPTIGDAPADFCKIAVDKALDSKNGEWDLFLRFLLGLSLETNQNLLKELLRKTEDNKETTNKETIKYIKEKIREENSDADQNCNLFYCLNELNDHSLVEEVKTYLQSETFTFDNFSTSQWSALTFVLLTSDEKLDVFDLKKYLKSEKVLLGMLPVVKVSKTALLSWCELSEESCRGLSSSVLCSPSCNLTNMDLSHNELLDSGVQLLAEGLKNVHCKLEILKLLGCHVTEKGCSFLASALKSKAASSLKQLDLSYNHPGADGAAMLSAIAADPNTSLQTLCLDHCGAHRLKPGLKKYGADLKLDENTASKRLALFDSNRKAKTVQTLNEKVQRPENDDRFKRTQVLCEKGLKGFCYWEVKWGGKVGIAVSYGGVGRKWDGSGGLGCNEKSWSLLCSKTGYTAIHGKMSKDIKPNIKKASKDVDSNDKKTSKDVKSSGKKTSKDVDSNDKKTSKDVKSSGKKTSKDVDSNDKKTSKDVKSSGKKTSEDVDSNDKKTSKDVESNDEKTSKNVKSNNEKTSNDVESNGKKTSKDVRPNDGTTAKNVESNDKKTFKDVKSNDKKTSKDVKPNDTKTSKDVKPNDTKTSKAVEFNDKKTSKDVKPNDTKTSKDVEFNDKKTSKDVKHINGKMSKDVKSKDEVPLCKKIGVFLDWEAGTLTYYGVTPEKQFLIHTFHAKFTEPLFPCFWFQKGSVTLCEMNICSDH
ncbi:uncharacterized protein [Clinocottus analis]|uniref:uncharacterized protein isoform X2 n=1 Tax=Clinocottus analis TaxID=304258 RepID=UPI0035C2607B